MKISTEKQLFEAGTSAQHQFFQKNYIFEKSKLFRKVAFRITHFFWRATFLEWLHFQKMLFSIATTFSEELLSHNIELLHFGETIF